MLAVAVDLHGRIEALLERIAEPRLHRASDAEVEREAHDARAVLPGDKGGGVDGSVVDDENFDLGVERPQLVNDVAHGVLLVERGHDRERPQSCPGDGRRPRLYLGSLRHACRF